MCVVAAAVCLRPGAVLVVGRGRKRVVPYTPTQQDGGDSDDCDVEEGEAGREEVMNLKPGKMRRAGSAAAPTTTGGTQLLRPGAVQARASQVPGAAAACEGVGSGAVGVQRAAGVLPQHVRERLWPTDDGARAARVAAEVSGRGGFQPLMPYFPISSDAPEGCAAAVRNGSHDTRNTDCEEEGVEVAGRRQRKREKRVSDASGALEGQLSAKTPAIPWGPLDYALKQNWNNSHLSGVATASNI